MTPREAFDLFAARPIPSESGPWDDLDYPTMMTAVVMASGRLDDCNSVSDLDAVVDSQQPRRNDPHYFEHSIQPALWRLATLKQAWRSAP